MLPPYLFGSSAKTWWYKAPAAHYIPALRSEQLLHNIACQCALARFSYTQSRLASLARFLFVGQSDLRIRSLLQGARVTYVTEMFFPESFIHISFDWFILHFPFESWWCTPPPPPPSCLIYSNLWSDTNKAKISSVKSFNSNMSTKLNTFWCWLYPVSTFLIWKCMQVCAYLIK